MIKYRYLQIHNTKILNIWDAFKDTDNNTQLKTTYAYKLHYIGYLLIEIYITFLKIKIRLKLRLKLN